MSAAPYPAFDGTQPCAEVDPELFFPAKGDINRTQITLYALGICRTRCPFLDDCHAYALTHDVDGIWAATTAVQRRRLRRAQGISALPVRTDVVGAA